MNLISVISDSFFHFSFPFSVLLSFLVSLLPLHSSLLRSFNSVCLSVHKSVRQLATYAFADVFLPGVCPNNWIQLQGSCYKFSSKTATWIAGKSACEAQRSKLAVVKSQAENKAITSRLKGHTHIGLHRDPKDPSSWLWTNGSRATYTNWEKGQPQYKQPNYEDCVVIFNSGYWHDTPCKTIKYYYVCETKG